MRMFSFIIGDGLLTRDGEEHRSLRRILNPAFSMSNLIKQFDHYHTHIDELCGRLSSILNEKFQGSREPISLDLEHLISNTMLDIICKTAFGVDLNAINDDGHPLAQSYHSVLSLQSGPNVSVKLYSTSKS